MASDNLLIIGPSWVGDMILAQSLFRLLRIARPQVQIDVAAPAWTLPLLERMPEVRSGIPLPFRHGKFDLAARLQIGRSLRGKHYHQAILLTNSFKSAILPWAAGIPRRTGFRGEMRYGLLNDIRPLDKTRLPRTVDRFCALGLDSSEPLPTALPMPMLTTSREQGLATLVNLGAETPMTPVLGLCPGAEYGPAKRWPEAYYATVANWALDRGWQVWIFGSHKDIPVTQKINARCQNRCLDLGGRTQLGEAIDLMALTTAVVSNDSGLMHLAAALQRPLIAIYGSSDPRHTPPMSTHARVLHLGLACSPCFERECPLGHLRCLREIAPERVISHLQEMQCN